MLRIADAGDIVEPDGPDGEERTRDRVRDLTAQAGLVIALGGDNSVTYATAGRRRERAHHDRRALRSARRRRQRLAGAAPRRRRPRSVACRPARHRRLRELGRLRPTRRRPGHHGRHARRPPPARRGRRCGGGLSRSPARAMAASTSTSMSTCATVPSLRAVPPRCRAGCRPGSCARSFVPWHPTRASSAPISSRWMPRPMPRTSARSASPPCASSNHNPRRCADDDTRARSSREERLGPSAPRRPRPPAQRTRPARRTGDGGDWPRAACSRTRSCRPRRCVPARRLGSSAKALGVEPQPLEQLYGAPASVLLGVAVDSGVDSVLIVAHDPGMTVLAEQLSTAASRTCRRVRSRASHGTTATGMSPRPSIRPPGALRQPPLTRAGAGADREPRRWSVAGASCPSMHPATPEAP